jgi:pimeloyl-ACP methyl ester carboxylesterase
MSLRVSLQTVDPRSPRCALSALWFSIALLSSMSSACKVFNSTCQPDDRTCLGGGLLRSGQPCIRTGDCATGLSCEKNSCEYAGTTARGGACIASAECAAGNYCSIGLQCTALSQHPQGATGPCATSADCQQGLVCDVDISKLFTQGPFGLLPDDCADKIASDETPAVCELPKQCTKRGKAELGATCKTNADCLTGLYCAPNPINTKGGEICIGGIKLSAEPVSIPRWDGASCPEDAKTPIAYFDVPRAGKPLPDFYRLPFPNDIRRLAGAIDLSGHPSPPAGTDPPAAERFIEAAATVDGFATNPVIFFRFSQALSADELSLNTRIVDITKDSPEYGQQVAVAWGPTERSSRYICPHWLGLHRLIGSPLRPGTTYAALISVNVKARSGSAFERSPDFDAVLAANRPSDADLARAWERYAPLRAYLLSDVAAFPSDQVLNAAVFTTQDATAILPQLRAAVQAAGVPELSELTRCAADVKSPCEDATGRGACHAENDDFIEIHGHVALPAFQSGTAPYESPDDGGGLALDASGNPQQQGHAKVCFALSIPKKTPAPAAGYPVLIVAHGTGGAFSDPMGKSGISAWAAKAKAASAVLAIDMPSHGSRRGDSTRPPEDLFFNFLNPAAARGNVLQGAADLMSLTLLAAPGISAQASPTKQAIKFDVNRIVLFGHSQGATHAALMIAYEPRVRAVVLSGLGGHLASSLRLKEKPVNLGKILPFALFDADKDGNLVGGDVNPMLALIQSYFESADPLNYARYLYKEPPASAAEGHDVFMTYGLFDSYAPERTQEAYANAAGLLAVAPDLVMKFDQEPPPLSENVMPDARYRTAGLRTYDPVADPLDGQPSADGHFVASQTKRGLTDVRRFLEQALNGQTPQIGE